MFQAIHRAVKVSIGHVTFSSIQTQRIPLGLNKISVQSKIPDVSIPLLNIGAKILIN
uniref:ORF56b n=1 Tax=Pinus thunbergii TaxID=3350 RepID=Q32957_PINTH|nr:ORF56b [Pinus thunbergii]BAA04373.1 ORF56b [Pinus thunbergii]